MIKRSTVQVFVNTICFLFAVSVTAQSVTISEGIEVRNDTYVDLLGSLKDKVLILRQQNDEAVIQAYDFDMRYSWEKNLVLERDEDVDIKHVVRGDDNFCVFYGFKKKGTYYLKAKKFDAAAEMIDTAMILVMEKPLYIPRFKIVESESREMVLIHHLDRSTDLYINPFNIKTMRRPWDQKLVYKRDKMNEEFHSALISDEGKSIIVLDVNNRKPDIREHHFHFLTVDSSMAQREFDVPLKGYLTYDAHFVFDNMNGTIAAGGMYSERNITRADGYFYMNISTTSPGDFVMQYNKFDIELTETFGKRKKKKKRGHISEATVQDIIMRRDGGMIVLVEYVKKYERNYLGNSVTVRQGLNSLIDYSFEDVAVISVHPSGDEHWSAVLHKRQYSQDDGGSYSSYYLMMGRRNIRLLYNDDIRLENTVSEYVIGGDGHIDRRAVMNTEDQKIKLQFQEAIQLNANAIVVPSLFRYELKLVKVEYE